MGKQDGRHADIVDERDHLLSRTSQLEREVADHVLVVKELGDTKDRLAQSEKNHAREKQRADRFEEGVKNAPPDQRQELEDLRSKIQKLTAELKQEQEEFACLQKEKSSLANQLKEEQEKVANPETTIETMTSDKGREPQKEKAKTLDELHESMPEAPQSQNPPQRTTQSIGGVCGVIALVLVTVLGVVYGLMQLVPLISGNQPAQEVNQGTDEIERFQPYYPVKAEAQQNQVQSEKGGE